MACFRILFLALSPLLVFAAQVPLLLSADSSVIMNASWKQERKFEFKTGNDIFSPINLIELPRPGAGIANDVGDVLLVPVSKYSFKDKENRKSIWLASIETKVPPLNIPLVKGGDAFWLDSYTVAHVVSSNDDKYQELYTISVKFDTQGLTAQSSELVGTFPAGAQVQNFRYSRHASRLIFSAYVFSDLNLNTVAEKNKEWEERGNSALVYDETFERHWDTWTGPKKSSLFTVRLGKNSDGKWELGNEFEAPLKGTKHSVPVEPFGGTDDFDISDTHIVYTTKDTELAPSWHTRQNVYVVDFFGKEKPRELTSGKQGATHSPVFSKSGTKVAWLELDKDGYESDRAKIVIYDLEKDVRFTLTRDWDRSPESLEFSNDDYYIYFTAGDEARVKVFALPIPPTPEKSTNNPTFPSDIYKTPITLTASHSASAIQSLPNGRLIYSISSFTHPNVVFIIRGLSKPESPLEYEQITQFGTESLADKNLDEGTDFRFKGADDREVQGWALKPKGWREGVKKQFPVVLLIHGGPQGAWEDQWSTRWNPNVFTQQGYFVVAINPTGSTTFGQDFTDAIAKDWGGKPFVDLQKGWKYILDTYPEIDPDKAVAAGASWGGYAINWIQGHPEFGFKFQAIVCHDGVFDTRYNGFATDELFFFNHDFGGRPWDPPTRELVEKYNPLNFVTNWSTPQLIIHGSKDFRLPDTEGISVFHTLQQLGIPSRLVIFPDENHWVLKHGNSLKWHYEIFRWFDEHLNK